MEGSSSTVRQRTPHSTTDITIDEEPANTHSLAEVEFEIVDWDEEIRLARLSVADRMKRQGLKDDCLTEEEEDQKEKGEEVNKKDDDVERGAGASADADQPKAEPQIFTGNWKDDVPPVTEAKRETAEEEEESCRICFGGQEEELGRLFSPCLCRGTARFVHTACLDRWRATSAGGTSSYKCDQCRYVYRLRRTKISGLAGNKFALTSLTVFLLMVLLYLAGFLASAITDAVDHSPASAYSKPSFFEEFYISDGAIIREAVGGAWSLLDQILSGSRVESDPAIEKWNDEPDIQKDPNAWDEWKERQSFPTSARGRSTSDSNIENWIRDTIRHLLKGASLVGVLSGFSSLFSFSMFGLRGTLFRAIRQPQRRGGGRDQRRGEGINLIQLALVTFVILGVVKAASQVYRMVKWGARKSLKSIEGLVMDVN